MYGVGLVLSNLSAQPRRRLARPYGDMAGVGSGLSSGDGAVLVPGAGDALGEGLVLVLGGVDGLGLLGTANFDGRFFAL